MQVYFLLSFSDDGPELPKTVNEEFRPFIRRLPEFKFWYISFSLLYCVLICIHLYQTYLNLETFFKYLQLLINASVKN